MNTDAIAALPSTQIYTDAAVRPQLMPAAQSNEADFGSMLLSGVMRADNAVLDAQAAVERFALGDQIPPHQVMLALEEARLSLQFALQVRSRLVEGYQELMRIQL